MKKILLIISVTILLILSCTNDGSPETNDQSVVLTIEHVTITNANIGDTITINGENFNPQTTYSIAFNGVSGLVVENNLSYLKVLIPENATSGNITITYDGTTKTIGEIEINVDPISKLYVHKKEGFHSIVELDFNDGSEVSTIATSLPENYSNPVFNEITNEIIGSYSTGGHVDPISNEMIPLEAFLHKINLETGTVTEIEIESAYYKDLVISENGKLYAYKKADTQSIVEINSSNGNEISTIATGLPDYYSNISFNEVTKEIIGNYSNGGVIDPINFGTPSLQIFHYRISITNGELTESDVAPLGCFQDFIVPKNGDLYAFRIYLNYAKLVKLDNDGNEISTVATFPDVQFNFIPYNTTNEFIGIRYHSPSSSRISKVNIMTGEVIELEVPAHDYGDLIISYN